MAVPLGFDVVQQQISLTNITTAMIDGCNVYDQAKAEPQWKVLLLNTKLLPCSCHVYGLSYREFSCSP